AGCFHVFGLYRKRSSRDRSLRLIGATTFGSSCALFFVFTSRSATFGFDAVFLVWLIALSLTLVFRFLLQILIAPTETSRHPRQVLMVGTGARAVRVAGELLAFRNRNYQLLGFV